jgi:DNA polymerase-3 subunit alpha
MNPRFVHLHTHSHYSLLDGLSKVDALVKQTKALGQEAIAITDHGVMYSAIEFYKAARKQGIKPILGVETYVAPRDRFSKEANERYYHLILLAKNEAGWKNLIKLVSYAHLEGFYYRPRIDKDLLRNIAKD